ncbi:hypothetical protein FRACA_1490013 [Frankia canadensis]|uniref:Uncharacterized protein n=1 Tax=Frankia canadensis TaxID=1836972 RepID=A0A2I2KLS9_9ACTN|nr:hypothetical protein FRACA_1490013 [Frankia canadensis]SOU53911.1 hypothetical protein FRACA_1490013 [Frankia canadensis]
MSIPFVTSHLADQPSRGGTRRDGGRAEASPDPRVDRMPRRVGADTVASDSSRATVMGSPR